MGNSPTNAYAFNKNWRHVAPFLLRNQLTHQLIEQHFLIFANPDQQLLETQLLAKRIRLHHSHIVKLIYYSPQNQIATCSPMDKPYRIQVYTEYPGDCLVGFMRLNQLPRKSKNCKCLSLLQGAIYLQQFYGCFEIAEDRVFIDLQPLQQKQPSVKVWIHADRAQCQPQKSCTQQQMVQNLIRLYSFMRWNGFCNTLTEDCLKTMSNTKRLAQLKIQLGLRHGLGSNYDTRKIKSFSASDSKSKKDFSNIDKSIEYLDLRPVSHHNVSIPHEAFSMPLHFNQKKVIFNNDMIIFDSKRKKQVETPSLSMPGPNMKPNQRLTSTQTNVQFINTPQLIQLNQEANKEKKQRINFNYMSVDSYADKKTVIPFKHQNKIINFKDQPRARNKVVSAIQFKYKERQINNTRQKTDFTKETTRLVKDVELRTIQQPVSIPISCQISFPQKQEQNQNSKAIDAPQDILANSENTISNSQPSVQTTNQPITNSEQRAAPQTLTSQNQNNQIQEKALVFIPNLWGQSLLQAQTPLHADLTKHLSSHLPTTSRSPNKAKQVLSIEPISQISQVMHSKLNPTKKNKMVYPEHMFSSRKSSRKFSLANTMSKNQKLQRYVKEIRQYEQNIRHRLTSSTGNKKYKAIVQNYEKMLKPETRSDKQAVFTEAKSINNDQECPPMVVQHQRLGTEVHEWREADKIWNMSNKQQEYLNQRPIEQQKQIEQYEKQLKKMYLRQQKQQRSYIKQVDEQREREKKFQIERLKRIAHQEKRKIEMERLSREKQQKIELQKDLEFERRHIQNQMNDLFKQNALKDEYKSIRDKVKQKKETFAQLKAEAAKILQDCLN